MANSGTTVYPGALDSFNRVGTTNYRDESGYSDVALANQAMALGTQITSVLGTTGGTSVLKDFTAGKFAARTAGETMTTLTANNATFGTPAITGGTANNITLGTPTTDVISEKTGAAGVTIDSLLIKDGDIPNARLKSGTIIATRDMTAASGDVQYSGLSFTPSSIICFFAVESSQVGGWGLVDSAKVDESMIRYSATGLFSLSTGAFIWIEPGAAGNSQSAIVKTYDAGGKFTLTWTKAGSPTGTAKLVFLCFG